MKKYILFFVIMTLVSCNKVDIWGLKKNVLNISVKNENETKTLVEDTLLPDGSEIGIFVIDESGRTYDANTVANVKYTAAGEGDSQNWNTISDIMLSTTKATIQSYYPYDESVTDITAIPIEATSDVQKDWMWGTPTTDIDNTNNIAVITMNHALAAVKLNIKKENYPGIGNVSFVSFSSNGAGTSAVMNATNGELSDIKGVGYTFESTEEFTIGNETTSVSFIAVPTNTAAPLALDFIVDGKHMKVQTADITLLPGNIYECNLSINMSTLSLSKLNVTKWTVEQMENIEVNPYAPIVNINGTTTNMRIEHDYKDRILTVKAYPFFEGYEINKVNVTGGIPIQTIDGNGVRTIEIYDANSSVSITFNGISFKEWARIQHVDGTLYTAEEWTAAEEAGTVTDADANGVAVRYSKYVSCPHIIYPKYSTSILKWSNNSTTVVPNLPEISSSTNAQLDINGKANTEAILAAVANGYISDAPAAQYCVDVTFSNGEKGYLPAAGELQAWYDNAIAVNACMNAIGGDKVNDYKNHKYTVSSSQYSKSGVWHWTAYNSCLTVETKSTAYVGDTFARAVSIFTY